MSKCPECYSNLMVSVIKCSCGWKRPVEISAKLKDTGCSYRCDDIRCPLVATMSEGNTNIWYCRHHYHTRHSYEKSRKAYDFIIKNMNKSSLQKDADWRKKLFEGLSGFAEVSNDES